MSRVLGVDLSSFAIDLVKLDENEDRGEWHRVEMPAARKRSEAPAWERTLALPDLMPRGEFWDDIYQVAIEAPYGSNQGGTQAILNRVVGVVLASVPADLRVPERCWIVRPDEWKRGLGLKAKPTWFDLKRLMPAGVLTPAQMLILPADQETPEWQNGRDAFCLALWVRETNRRSLEAEEANLATRALELF